MVSDYNNDGKEGRKPYKTFRDSCRQWVILGGGVVAGGNKIKKKISDELAKKRKEAEAAVVYTVNAEGRSKEGLLFKVGDTFRILEADGDAGLIEKIDDENNPYFVSLKFLSNISDYILS